MAHFSIARGTTLAFKSVARRSDGTIYQIFSNGIPPNGTRILFVAKINQTDPDSAAVALFDNVTGSGQGVVTLTDGPNGKFNVTMQDSATYPLPTSVTELFYEIYIHAITGERWRTETGDIQLTGRSLVQQV
jgi:hypothetical protein